MKNLKKEIKTVLKAVAAAGMATFLFGAVSEYIYSCEMQKGISEEVVRFHVLANSDSCEDQKIKLNVRDNVLKAIEPVMESCDGKDEAMAALEKLRPLMKKAADDTLEEIGVEYRSEIKIENCFFPVKNYGSAVFPAGKYDAVRIELGNGEGKNWWCVMYPSMCFVEESLETGQEEKLKNILTEEEYSIVMREELPEMKLRIFELWPKPRQHEIAAELMKIINLEQMEQM